MKFNKLNKLVLFGGSRILFDFVDHLKKQKFFGVVVFGSKRHLDEIVPGKNFTLRAFLKKNKIKYYDSEDINKDKNLEKEAKDSLGIAFGAPWIFEKHTVSLFKKNHLLDFMGIDLPRYKGGAHYTWQILHGNTTGCANLQIIHGGITTFHKGEILSREKFLLPKNLQTPMDYFDFISKKEIEFLKKFLAEMVKGKDFKTQNLDETKSSYFPFLNTKIHGFINWNWSGKDICLFINAFDKPYSGASTFLNGKKVFLKNCRLFEAEEQYHPFTSGIVVRNDKKNTYIASIGNLLVVDVVLEVRVGDRFVTPHSYLDDALSFSAVYNSKGLKNKKTK